MDIIFQIKGMLIKKKAKKQSVEKHNQVTENKSNMEFGVQHNGGDLVAKDALDSGRVGVDLEDVNVSPSLSFKFSKKRAWNRRRRNITETLQKT